MKISYIINARIPTEKAHGYQIVKVCEEFAKQGATVELVTPYRHNDIKKSIFEYYSIKKNFNVITVSSFDFFSLKKLFGEITFTCQRMLFCLSLLFKYHPAKDVVIYTRDPEVVWLYGKKGYKTVYNAHNWPLTKQDLFMSLVKGASKVIANSKGTALEFEKRGFKNVLVVPNGVDIAQFDEVSGTKEELRSDLGLPLHAKIVMYVGHLYKWKGVETILSAAALVKNNDIVFVVIGGTIEDVAIYSKKCTDVGLENVKIMGHKEKKKIPYFLKAADILLLPNNSSSRESKYYTSPIKMFEYMASGVPIIASDLPSIREVLNDSNSTLVKAEDAAMLASVVENISIEKATVKADQAKKDVESFTWEKHVSKIIEFIEK